MTRQPADHTVLNNDDYNGSEPVQAEEQVDVSDDSEPLQEVEEQFADPEESSDAPDSSIKSPAFDCIGKTYEEIEQEWGP